MAASIRIIFVVATVVATAIPRTRNYKVMEEGERDISLPFVEVGTDGAAAMKIKKDIEHMGGWWAHIGNRVYSPIASWANPRYKDDLAFISTDVSKTQSIEGYYVAIGGTKKSLPDILAPHRVGGSDPFHILHMPNITTAQRAMLMQVHSKMRGGNRHQFHSLIKLKRGFTPFQPFEASNSYKAPDGVELMQRESAAVESMTKETFHAYLQDLVNFKTRAVGADNANEVQNYFVNKFRAMGFRTCKQPVQVGSTSSNNILAFKASSDPSAKYVVVGAHYDSRPFTGLAPGAEDNGSGSAALLTMAEAFANRNLQTRNNVVFVAFTGEEEGLYGSTEFVANFGQWGEACMGQTRNPALLEVDISTLNLEGAIIMDEIGWASDKFDKHTVTLETRKFSRSVMDHLASCSKDYNSQGSATGELMIQSSFYPFGSDHMPFLNKGSQAVLTINGDDEAYPNYHKSTDTIENVNDDLSMKIARMNLCALIRMSEAK
uniref:Peptidase M28 domain-containing protein n=1 Tax=Lotharella oceanica TaxID=641309 RepID=A0A7S2TKG8_9EUKA|mmetsp:Transcript_15729/g.29853  ORF Transcript_15729/g.29853 Transcript_15729/m.29853 type:complete len:490 (+) Transcript_15729:27-1496(+)